MFDIGVATPMTAAASTGGSAQNHGNAVASTNAKLAAMTVAPSHGAAPDQPLRDIATMGRFGLAAVGGQLKQQHANGQLPEAKPDAIEGGGWHLFRRPHTGRE